MNDDMELYLKIDDDFQHIQYFDPGMDYPDCHDNLTNNVRISIFAGDATISYLECVVFYDDRIAETPYDHVYLADSMVQDAYDAMFLLQECSLLIPTDDNKSLGEFLTSYPTVTVYLQHIAVREEYRHKGIGNWLLKNLSQILLRNYSVFPRLIITLLSPQMINWNTPIPGFNDPEKETSANMEMYNIMKRLFEDSFCQG